EPARNNDIEPANRSAAAFRGMIRHPPPAGEHTQRQSLPPGPELYTGPARCAQKMRLQKPWRRVWMTWVLGLTPRAHPRLKPSTCMPLPCPAGVLRFGQVRSSRIVVSMAPGPERPDAAEGDR